jgi:lysophospholipase L1-like esterase
VRGGETFHLDSALTVKYAWFKNAGLIFASLLLAEALLHVASSISPPVRAVLRAPWERDHDSRGYRNAHALRQAQIVALGDSHTYGSGVSRQDTWPQLVAMKNKMTVYNMGKPGLGPADYVVQLDQALRLSPHLVIVALYFGNDFYDTFHVVLQNPDIRKDAPHKLMEQALKWDFEKPLEARIQKIQAALTYEQTQNEKISALHYWLSANSKLYGMFRATYWSLASEERTNPLWLKRDFKTAAAGLTAEQLVYCSIFDDNQWHTLLTAPYRGLALDDRDPRIRVGFEVSRELLRSIQERTASAKAKLLVLLLPTKESVFWPRVQAPEKQIGLAQLVADEDRLRAEIIETLRNDGISYLDLLSALRTADRQPYFENIDGHPNEVGHQVIAAEVSRWLSSTHLR